MKIAMTGASGFIGQQVVASLLSKGHQVTAILHQTPLPLGHQNLKTISIPLGQLATSPLAYARLHEPDVFLDLGWQHLNDYQHASHLGEQPQLHLALVTNLVRQGLARVVSVGTCFEYGSVRGPIDEKRVCMPDSNYAMGKLTLLQLLQALQQKTPFELVWLRPFYVYGLNPNRKTLFSLIQQAIDDGAHEFELKTPWLKHDFLPVKTLALYLAQLAVHPKARGVINCGSGQLRSVLDVAREYVATVNGGLHVQAPTLLEQPKNNSASTAFWANCAKLQKLLACAPNNKQ